MAIFKFLMKKIYDNFLNNLIFEKAQKFYKIVTKNFQIKTHEMQ